MTAFVPVSGRGGEPVRRPSPRVLGLLLLVLLATPAISMGLIARSAALTVGPGVIFQPSLSWATLSFASTQTFSTITVDETGVTFDAVRIGVQKFPAGTPRASLTITAWSPLTTVVDATVLRFTGDSPAGSSLYFGLSNVLPAREYVLQVDGAESARRFSDGGGNVLFVASNWSIHDLHVLLGPRSGLPGPGPLAADFVFSPANPAVDETISFDASVAGGTPPYSATWDFADGGTATGLSATHAYSVVGTYSVTLYVADGGAQTKTIAKSLTVGSAPPPPSPLAADFAFSPSNARAGDPVAFAASGSGGTPPYAFSWDFGDGGTASGMFANHVFSAEGTYTVTLSVTDAASGLDIVARSVQVQRAPVVGNVTAAFEAVVNGFTVTFIDRSVSGVGAAIVRWLWVFGDDTSSAEARANHTYQVAGFFATFTVLLYAYDAEGNVGSTSRDVTLTNGPLLYGTIGGILVAVAVPIGVLWWLRRRRKRPE